MTLANHREWGVRSPSVMLFSGTLRLKDLGSIRGVFAHGLRLALVDRLSHASVFNETAACNNIRRFGGEGGAIRK
jgi:hypothetical protein